MPGSGLSDSLDLCFWLYRHIKCFNCVVVVPYIPGVWALCTVLCKCTMHYVSHKEMSQKVHVYLAELVPKDLQQVHDVEYIGILAYRCLSIKLFPCMWFKVNR